MAIVQQIKVPLISVNDTSLTVVDILFTHAAKVQKGTIVLVFETSKTTYDVVAEEDGYIAYYCKAGEEYDVNFLVATIYSTASEVPQQLEAGNNNSIHVLISAPLEVSKTWQGETFFSAAAIALMDVKGTPRSAFAGRDFVGISDVEEMLGIVKIRPSESIVKVEKKSLQPAPNTDVVRLEKLSSNKKIEIAYLSAVQASGLTSTINAWIETEGIFVHINQSLQFLKNSLLPIILYETARLLQKYPALNAYFAGDEIAYYKKVNIGFAIDINKGLKVLTIADTNLKGIGEIENEVIDLSNKYLDDKLHINDLTNIGFTVTDLSGEGVAFFKPLVNMMNSAILGVSSIDKKLQRCMLSLTFDHRVTEGKLAAQFLNELTQRVESYQSKHHPLSNQNIGCFKCFKLLQDDLSNVGFAKCITPKGEEGYICQSCLKGF